MTSAATSSRSAPASTTSRTKRRAMGDEFRAQRPDADPGAGRELEVLGDAAVEQQALVRIGRVLKLERVAELIKPLLVERRRRDGFARANSRA